MSKFDEMFERLHKEVPSREHQIAVVDLIAESLEQTQQSFGYWEKENLAYAIAALTQNFDNAQGVTDLWLRLALVSAEKALVPKNQRNESYGRKDKAIDGITHEQLVAAIVQFRTAL